MRAGPIAGPKALLSPLATPTLAVVTIVNIREAKTRLSRLLAEVAEGEEIVITKSGRPRARFVPAEPSHRLAGFVDVGRGRIAVHDDFTVPLPDDLLVHFERA
jgi:prevent-host-death family protein